MTLETTSHRYDFSVICPKLHVGVSERRGDEPSSCSHFLPRQVINQSSVKELLWVDKVGVDCPHTAPSRPSQGAEHRRFVIEWPNQPWLPSRDMGCLFTERGNKVGWRRRTETLSANLISATQERTPLSQPR